MLQVSPLRPRSLGRRAGDRLVTCHGEPQDLVDRTLPELWADHHPARSASVLTRLTISVTACRATTLSCPPSSICWAVAAAHHSLQSGWSR